MNFDLSAKLCDAVEQCATWWNNAASAAGVDVQVHSRDWRADAVNGAVERREKTDPTHNNYDGRNYITE